MDNSQIYVILKDIVQGLAKADRSFKPLPDAFKNDLRLDEAGLDLTTLPEVAQELEARLKGKDLGLGKLFSQEILNSMTMGTLVESIRNALTPQTKAKIVVYVDDEEENLFIFNRKFGKRLNLKTFTNPIAALDFIRAEEKVGLVVTDEVMPNLSGSALCDEVHKTKPFMKFILITGNPNSDEDLMYKALRKHRFYEFINKPVDFEGKGEEYFNVINGLLDFDW
jgi:CheY-like chemotaxis protein